MILAVDINLHTNWQTVQIQISWLLQKPTDLDLHCLQRQGISGFSRNSVNLCLNYFWMKANILDPDQVPHSVASHLGLHCLLRSVRLLFAQAAVQIYMVILENTITPA